MSILLLASEGKLSLADDVRKYVPELPLYQKVITLQMLLNHTSGLKDWGVIGGLSGWPRTTRVYTQALALEILTRQKTTNFLPGTEYSYSNTNYSLLVTIVERVSGMSLAEFTSVKIFKPLQMKNTRWRDNFHAVVPNRAVGYQRVEGGYEQLMPFENVHGHGGLLTTAGDLLRWNALLETHALGGDDVYAERVRCGKLANGKEITYAAGLQVSKYNGFREVAHSGATAGYRAWLAYYPEKRLSVVLLSNDASFVPSGIGRQVANVFFGATPPKVSYRKVVLPTAHDLRKFDGYFRSTRHFEYHQFKTRGDTVLIDGEVVTFAAPDTLVQGANKWAYIKQGRIQIIQSGDTLSFSKVDPPKIRSDVAGQYHSDEVGADYLFSFDKNELLLKIGSWPARILRPVFKDAYTDNEGVLYEFLRSKSGQVQLVNVSASRAEKIPFQKMK